ncbi:hypothetical protein C2S51_032498 [Perilla frutescens var. frutescens]|nr:hypothetical protein C2S51_032498 [Perilla frutescens var. frutescens]
MECGMIILMLLSLPFNYMEAYEEGSFRNSFCHCGRGYMVLKCTGGMLRMLEDITTNSKRF